MKAWNATIILGLTILLHGCGISGDSGPSTSGGGELAIENIAVTSVTDSSAVVEWTTSLDAVSTFLYGTNQSLLGLSKNSPLGKSHVAELGDLQEDTEYHFRITAEDGVGSPVETDLSSLRTEVSEDQNDTTPPVISDIQVVGVTPSSVTIVWNTDDRTEGFVGYGPGLANNVSTPAGVFKRNHSVVISGLSDDAEYDFQIFVSNRAQLNAQSSPSTFRTEALPSLTIEVDDTSVSVDETFTFTIEVNNANNVAGLQVMVNYQASKLEILDVDPGEFFNNGGHIWLIGDPDLHPIEANFSWHIDYEGQRAVGSRAPRSGTLAVIKARARATSDGSEISFQLLPADAEPGTPYDANDPANATRLLDHNREVIPVTVRDATIEIS